MRKLLGQAGPALKIVCLILAALLLYQMAGMVLHWNPFRGVTVPALPSLAAETNSPAGGSPVNNPTAPVAAKKSKSPQPAPETNSAPTVAVGNTNAVSQPASPQSGTNSSAQTKAEGTNNIPEAIGTTNALAKLSSTNPATGTALIDKGTNLSMATNSAGTNIAHIPNPNRKSAGPVPVPVMAGMHFGSFPPAGSRNNDLPPALQARIDRITESEILGPVIRPLPMALLGIAGNYAFLRADSGQEGIVKEGDTLGDLKLLRIGINRVLVEKDGQEKELMIFSGYGGESLMQKNTTNENNHP